MGNAEHLQTIREEYAAHRESGRIRKSNAERIESLALREIDYQKRGLDSLIDLQEVTIRIKFDRKTKQPRFVHLTIETEREIT